MNPSIPRPQASFFLADLWYNNSNSVIDKVQPHITLHQIATLNWKENRDCPHWLNARTTNSAASRAAKRCRTRGVGPGDLTLARALKSESSTGTGLRLLMYLFGAGRGGRVYCVNLSSGTSREGFERTPRRTFHETRAR